jgi:hypothetical protein
VAEALGLVAPDGTPLALNWTQAINGIRDLKDERDDVRREKKQACIALADGFVPKADRAGAHLHGLPWLVAHAVAHHQWHHDAQDAAYVRGLEEKLHAAAERLRAVRTLLEANGCDCPCDHHRDERGPDCDVCLGCRIGDAVGGPGRLCDFKAYSSTGAPYADRDVIHITTGKGDVDMAEIKMTLLDEFIESLTIFKKYADGFDGNPLCTDDGGMIRMAACSKRPDEMDPADVKRLGELGWLYDDEDDDEDETCWFSFRFAA